ncbi:hypothetical protein BDV29DRAFT_170276 [Aspergillus leporis]|uniref:Uncharacterized protein n=1 Tax=Aspergillus leporis TaxID=41062 RepID=A0A5N5XAM8_9EURO|nr:hypothetical protein BDV29DRAFT_170276 [Aspergillus leporis]
MTNRHLLYGLIIYANSLLGGNVALGTFDRWHCLVFPKPPSRIDMILVLQHTRHCLVFPLPLQAQNRNQYPYTGLPGKAEKKRNE